MGEIDRTAAAKRFEDALEQFEESLDLPEAPDPGAPASESPDSNPPRSTLEQDPPLPLETKLLRRLRSPQREQQLAAMEAAIADQEAYLHTNPAPQIHPDSDL
jgi:hypothetical protein